MDFLNTIKIFSIQHFLVIILLYGLIAIGLFYVRKNIDNKKNINSLLFVLSILLLFFWITCRISHIYHSIDEGIFENFFGQKRYYNWLMILPNSFCSFIGLVLPFIIITKKYKDSKFIEATYSMAILGLVTNTIYPDYIVRMPFYQFRVFGSILYHVLCGFIMIVLLITGYLKPKLKNWYYTPLALVMMISFGFFELFFLSFPESFNITKPLVPGVFLTNLVFLCIGYIIVDLLFRLIFQKIVK